MKDDAAADRIPPCRHRPRALPEELRMSRGDGALIDAMQEHLERCFPGSDVPVLHETISPLIHLDVMVVTPTADYPYLRLVTCGMAELPMHVPPDWSDTPYAELSIALPQHWPVAMEALRDERFSWPVRLLKQLGRLPHEKDTFLWPGHTIHGDDAQTYAPDTKLCASLIVPPAIAPPEFEEFTVGGERSVRIFGVLPLHAAELQVKLRYGLDVLLDLIADADLDDVVDPRRPSLVQPAAISGRGSRRSRPARRARRSTRAS